MGGAQAIVAVSTIGPRVPEKRKGIVMNILRVVLGISVFAAFVICGCEPVEPSVAEPKLGPNAAPVNEIREDGLVLEWMVMVFSVKSGGERTQSEDYFISTFEKDYLAPLGGEAKAVLAADTTVCYKDEAGNELTAKCERATAELNGWLGSEWDETNAGRKIAYAFCYLRSDKPQTVKCYFGCDDEGKIWLNGELVHESLIPRSCEDRDDSFTMKLKKGLNPLLVKTSQRTMSWVFVFEAYAAEE